MKNSKSRPSHFFFWLAILAGPILLYNNCSDVVFSQHPSNKDVITGNPFNPSYSAPEILAAMCSVLDRCEQVSLTRCQTGILAADGIDKQLGLPAHSYDPFSQLETAEQSGIISASTSATANCIQAIDSLKCDDPLVTNAYNPSAIDPFVDVSSMIPAQHDGCNDVYSNLQIAPQLTEINLSTSETFSASGGTAPYLFSLASGNGQISPNGIYQSPATPDMETVMVTDSLGHTIQETFTVASPRFTWTGQVDSNWNTPGNWLGGAVPGINDIAVFDTTCQSHCMAVINASIEVGGFYLAPNYQGTITQAPGSSITINNSFNQQGGFFAGGNSAIIVHGPWLLRGGSFTSTSGALEIFQNLTVSGTPSFNANNGLLQVNSDGYAISPGNASFNNVSFVDVYSGGQQIAGTMKILGDLTLDEPTALSGGTIDLSGNLIATKTTFGSGNDTLVRFIGNGTQTWSGSAVVPGIEMANSGSVVISGTVSCRDFKYTSGSVVASGSTVQFTTNGTEGTIDAGPMNFNNVAFVTPWNDEEVIIGTMNVLGNLTINEIAGFLSDGTISVAGNINMSKNAGGSASITFTGNASQSFSATGGRLPLGLIQINKQGGSVLTLLTDLNANNDVSENMEVTSGTVNLNSHALRLGGSVTIDGAGILECQGGCGTGIACGQDQGDLVCATLVNNGAIIP